MLNERLARALFASVILILPAQHFLSRRFGEPYPSLYMPSFAGDFTNNGKIQARSADARVRFCDGKERVLTPNELFRNLPSSHLEAVMDWMFGPRIADPRPLSPKQRWVARYVSPAYGERVLRARGKSRVDDRTKEWLRNRIATEYRDEPAALTILWFMDTYDISKTPPGRSRQVIAEVPIKLSSCS